MDRDEKIDNSLWWWLTCRIGIADGGSKYFGKCMKCLAFILHPMLYPVTVRKCKSCNRIFPLDEWRAWPIVNRYILCQCGSRTRQLTDRELDTLFTFALM